MTGENDVDYTQPLAALLKVATSAAHEQAEHSQGAEWLTRGELDKDEYVRFLMMLYHVYDMLEAGLEKHASHPVLVPTYNPTLLARAPSIAADIAYLLDEPENSWQSHPLHKTLISRPPKPFKEYVDRVRYLSDEAPDPSPLLAHAYVRYLGDLSGGQTIRRNIAKAYVSNGDSEGRGTQFYAFNKLGGGGPATAGDMRRIKDWFRTGMNEGGSEDTARKRAIADEAVYAFQLNMGLFTLLHAPSNAKGKAESSSEKATTKVALGNPDNSLPPTPPPESESEEKSSSTSLSKRKNKSTSQPSSSSSSEPEITISTSALLAQYFSRLTFQNKATLFFILVMLVIMAFGWTERVALWLAEKAEAVLEDAAVAGHGPLGQEGQGGR